LARGQCYDRRKLGVEFGFDLATFGTGRQHNLFNEPAHGLSGLWGIIGTGERVFEALDLGAIDLGDVGVDARQWRRGFGEAGFDLVLLAF
jgi:hypothetical protein